MKNCTICSKELEGRQRKYCSKPCQIEGNYDKEYHRQWRIRKGLIKTPDVGSGGAQWGSNNHRYMNGIGNYRKKALSHYNHKCNRCKTQSSLVVHHIDEDRTNNNISNLEILCKKCHQKHHENRCKDTGKYMRHSA